MIIGSGYDVTEELMGLSAVGRVAGSYLRQSASPALADTGDTVDISEEARRRFSESIHKYDKSAANTEPVQSAGASEAGGAGAGGASGGGAGAGGASSADDVESLRKQIESLKSQLMSLVAQAGEDGAASGAANSKMQALQAQITALEAQLNAMQA